MSTGGECVNGQEKLPQRKKSERIRLKNSKGEPQFAHRDNEFLYDWDSNDTDDSTRVWSNGASCAVGER